MAAAACGESGGTTQPASAPPAAAVEVDETAVLMVSGQVDLDSNEVQLSPTRSLQTARPLEPEPGTWQVVVEGTDGTTLATRSFAVIEQLDGDDRTARFNVAIQPQPTAPIGQLHLFRDGDRVASVAGSDSRPAVTVEHPAPGSTVSLADVEFRWAGEDADDDELTYAVYLSADGGISWTTLVTQTNETSHRPPGEFLDPASDAVLLVSVSDGLNATNARSASFKLTR